MILNEAILGLIRLFLLSLSISQNLVFVVSQTNKRWKSWDSGTWFMKKNFQENFNAVQTCGMTKHDTCYSCLQKSRFFGPRYGSRPLSWCNTGSPRFTDFPTNLTNLIGWEYETNTPMRMVRTLGLSRGPDSWRSPKGARSIWGREWTHATGWHSSHAR